MEGKHPLWKLRTKEEAADFWATSFPVKRSSQAEGEATVAKGAAETVPLEETATIKKAIV